MPLRSPDKLLAFAIFCHMALSCSQLTIKVADFAQSQSSFMSCHKCLICSQGARIFCTDPNPCYFKRFLQFFSVFEWEIQLSLHFNWIFQSNLKYYSNILVTKLLSFVRVSSTNCLLITMILIVLKLTTQNILSGLKAWNWPAISVQLVARGRGGCHSVLN